MKNLTYWSEIPTSSSSPEVELRQVVEQWQSYESDYRAKRKDCMLTVGRLLKAIKANRKLRWNDFAYMTGISPSYWCDMSRCNAKHTYRGIIKLLDELSKQHTNQ